jgi:hypothetical protein
MRVPAALPPPFPVALASSASASAMQPVVPVLSARDAAEKLALQARGQMQGQS